MSQKFSKQSSTYFSCNYQTGRHHLQTPNKKASLILSDVG